MMFEQISERITRAALDQVGEVLDDLPEVQEAAERAAAWYDSTFGEGSPEADDSLSEALALATAYSEAAFMRGVAYGVQLVRSLEAMPDARKLGESFKHILGTV